MIHHNQRQSRLDQAPGQCSAQESGLLLVLWWAQLLELLLAHWLGLPTERQLGLM